MIQLVLTLALIGFIVYLVITYIPMPAPMRTAIIVIVVVLLIIYLMGVLGIGDIPVPRLR